uniref:DHC_N1 domain-containing protein n=1 Tax=Rodentolepis nana TaxID=102285 RepID=A0A0R3TXB6_RODNA
LDAFGPCHSELKYDLRGLQRVYRKIKNIEKMREAIQIYDQWMECRRHHEAISSSIVVEDAMEGYLEPSSSFVTHLDTIWREFRSIFGTLLGGNGVEYTSQELEGEGSGSRRL